MGFFAVLKGSFAELRKNPLLFLPKMISVTIWLIPYILLMQSAKVDLLRATVSQETLLYTALIFILSPLWLIIDSMYPVLVLQQKKKKRLDFSAALRHVLGRLLQLLAFLLLLVVATTICFLPFAALLALGLALAFLPLIMLGILGTAVLVFIGGIALYFVPTSVILEKAGFAESFRTGFTLAQKNFSEVFWLTLISFLFLVFAFALEGTLGELGFAGFIVGRYLGGIVTVYLYVVNPTAYLAARKK